MLRSAQPSQFSTYPSQYIDTPGLAVLKIVKQTSLKPEEIYNLFWMNPKTLGLQIYDNINIVLCCVKNDRYYI